MVRNVVRNSPTHHASPSVRLVGRDHRRNNALIIRRSRVQVPSALPVPSCDHPLGVQRLRARLFSKPSAPAFLAVLLRMSTFDNAHEG